MRDAFLRLLDRAGDDDLKAFAALVVLFLAGCSLIVGALSLTLAFAAYLPPALIVAITVAVALVLVRWALGVMLSGPRGGER